MGRQGGRHRGERAAYGAAALAGLLCALLVALLPQPLHEPAGRPAAPTDPLPTPRLDVGPIDPCPRGWDTYVVSETEHLCVHVTPPAPQLPDDPFGR